MDLFCHSYCSHGGICELEPGYDGLHDSGYCRWSDAESLTKAAADEVLLGKPLGRIYLAMFGDDV